MLRDERQTWQVRLAAFRNDYLEHRRTLPHDFVEPFYTLAQAELMFSNAWEAMEDIAAVLLGYTLPPNVHLVEIPEAERDPGLPKRFRFTVGGLPSSE